MALAWGVLIGGVAQLAFQIGRCAKLGMLPRPALDSRDEGVRRVLLRDGAGGGRRVGGADLGAHQHAARGAASATARISWITYADRLMEFPSALLGVALGTVLLPSLAKHHSDANHAQYSALLDWGLRLAFLLALPAAVALWLLALPLVTTLYQYGKFTVNDALADARRAAGLQRRPARAHPGQDPRAGLLRAADMLKTPVKIAFVTVVVTQTLAVILAWPLGSATRGSRSRRASAPA